jgi:serine/threonine protein kinase
VVHKQTNAQIALKTYDKRNLKLIEAKEAVTSEIETLAKLKHPNIMRLHEVID